MKRLIWMLVWLLFGTTGCATHYYREKAQELHLYLLDPRARNVYLACSLDDFKPRRALKIRGKAWEVQLPADREFRYFYLVDDAVFLPPCRFTETDDFGSKNCIYIPGM